MESMKDIRAKSDAQLASEIASLKEELFTMRFQKATGQLDNPSKMKDVKKTIAKMMTVQSERRLGK